MGKAYPNGKVEDVDARLDGVVESVEEPRGKGHLSLCKHTECVNLRLHTIPVTHADHEPVTHGSPHANYPRDTLPSQTDLHLQSALITHASPTGLLCDRGAMMHNTSVTLGRSLLVPRRGSPSFSSGLP